MSSVPEIGAHQILNSVVHLPFKSAVKQVGCCEFAQQDFTTGTRSYLSKLSDPTLLDGIEVERLWSAMMNGEVLAVEYAENQSFIFQVRGKVSGQFVDMKFSYWRDNWDVLGITSIHHRPIWRSRSRLITEIVLGAAAVTVISILGVHSHTVAYTKQTVQNWAGSHGYKLVSSSTPQTYASPAKTTSPASSTGNSAASTANTTSQPNPSKSKAATPPAKPQKFSFTLKQGMSLHNISVFLQKHHLVKNAYAFDQVLHKTGVEKHVLPGTYTFHSGMNQKQILSVLKSRPS